MQSGLLSAFALACTLLLTSHAAAAPSLYIVPSRYLGIACPRPVPPSGKDFGPNGVSGVVFTDLGADSRGILRYRVRANFGANYQSVRGTILDSEMRWISVDPPPSGWSRYTKVFAKNSDGVWAWYAAPSANSFFMEQNNFFDNDYAQDDILPQQGWFMKRWGVVAHTEGNDLTSPGTNCIFQSRIIAETADLWVVIE